MLQPMLIMLIALYMIKLSRGKESLYLVQNTKTKVAAKWLASSVTEASLQSLKS